MRPQPIVKMQKGGKKVERRFQTNCKTNFNKGDQVSYIAVRTLHQHYGTIEAILRLLGLKECEGELTITVQDGVLNVRGEIMTYHQVAFYMVRELVDELAFTAGCLATQFEAGSVTATISFSQKLEYKSS